MPIDNDLVQKSTVLSRLTVEQLHRLAQVMKRKEYDAQSVIFEEGAAGDDMFFIEHGSVTISKVIEGDVRTPLATFETGQCFGEMTLVDEMPRSATAIAEQPTVLMSLTHNDFMDFMKTDPYGAAQFLTGVLWECNERLRHANELLRDTIYWGMRAGGHLAIAKEEAKQEDTQSLP